jgi:hypothetical protein
MPHEADDQWMTPNGGRDGQRRVQAAVDGPDEPGSPAQEQGSIRDASMDDEVVSELGSQVSKSNQVKYSIQVDVPKPVKLTAEDSDELQKVKVVQDAWITYWDNSGRLEDGTRVIAEDHGAQVWEDQALVKWHAVLNDCTLMKKDLQGMKGRDLFALLVHYLDESAKTVVTSNQDKLLKMRGQLKWDIEFGVDYPGWSKASASMSAKLTEIAAMFGDEFSTVKDDEALANAFLNTFQDPKFKNDIKNRAHTQGGNKNVFKLYREARRMMAEAGRAERNSLPEALESYVRSILLAGVPKSSKGKTGQSGSSGAGKVSGASGAAPDQKPSRNTNGGGRKCFSCGADGKGHDFRKCAKRTDHTPEEKSGRTNCESSCCSEELLTTGRDGLWGNRQ